MSSVAFQRNEMSLRQGLYSPVKESRWLRPFLVELVEGLIYVLYAVLAPKCSGSQAAFWAVYQLKCWCGIICGSYKLCMPFKHWRNYLATSCFKQLQQVLCLCCVKWLSLSQDFWADGKFRFVPGARILDYQQIPHSCCYFISIHTMKHALNFTVSFTVLALCQRVGF